MNATLLSATLTRALIAIGALLVLGGVNYSIFAKERIVSSGEIIYLELAPVDPRSIMQGDFMALRFKLAGDIEAARSSGALAVDRFHAPIRLDASGVAALDSAAGNLHIRYRVRNNAIWLGTNAYFFEEGTAQRYSEARFGEFRLDRESGEAVLVALRGEGLKVLSASPQP